MIKRIFMSILDSLLSPFRRRKTESPLPQPTIDPNNQSEPPLQTILKTLVIVYEPTMDQGTGAKLSEYMHWNNVEQLAEGYISDVLQASGGLVRHQIVQRIDVDGFPAKVDSFIYDPLSYLDVVRGMTPP